MKEVRRLKQYGREKTSVDAARAELEILSRSIPVGVDLDRVLRYGKDIERASRSIREELSKLQRNRQHTILELELEGQGFRPSDSPEKRESDLRDFKPEDLQTNSVKSWKINEMPILGMMYKINFFTSKGKANIPSTTK